jgi:ribosomal protein S27AE
MTLSKLEQLVATYGLEWDTFRDSLDEMGRNAFVSLIRRAQINAEAGSKIENPDLFESVVMSILVDHQREMQQLQEQLFPVDKKTCPRCSGMTSLEDFLKEERVTILCSRCQEALNYH